MPTNHFEVIPAKKYYGKHATGSVLLCNGQPEFHDKTKIVKEIYKKIIALQKARTK